MKTSKRKGFRVARIKNSNGTYHYEVYLGRVGGKRIRRYFKSREEAETFAEQQRIVRINQGTAAFTLGDKQRVEATECIRRLEAVGASLTVATDFYLHHARPSGGTRTWSEAVAELLEGKKQENARESYVKALGWSLHKFGRVFGERNVSTIFATDVEKWLSEQQFKASATRAAYIRDLGILFRFCVDKGYSGNNPVAKIKKPKPDDAPPEIFTVDEAAKLLRASREHPELGLGASLSIGLLGGLRTCEIKRLCWSEINLKRRVIEVKAAKSKTRQRRIVKITESLHDWLAPFERDDGRVVPPGWRDRMIALRGHANVRWKKNGMRHSFASYHLGRHEDANSTALQLGHADTNMLFSHYRELVHPEDAAAYWQLSPAGVSVEA